MRRNAIVFGMSMFILGVFLFSPALGQFPGGGKKGGGFGGFSPGGFGGGGNPFGGGGMMNDPSRTFDFLAKGRPYFLITETRSLREPLQQFLRQKGVTNDQVTRELFTQFSDQMKTTMSGGASPAIGGPRGPTGFPQGATMFPTSPTGPTGMPSFAPSGFSGGAEGFPRSRGNSFEMMNQWADSEFNRRDVNGDGVLNLDEMPDAIKSDLARYDTNHDNLIDANEYRAYFMARLSGGDGARNANPVTIILEEEFDKRPTVLRAGKLPKELKWFEDLDFDKDGQIALWEWRRAGKDMDEFATYDRNDDGFITPEEGLRVMSARGNGSSSGDEEGSIMSLSRKDKGEGGFNRGTGGEFRIGNPDEMRARMEEFRKKFGESGGKDKGPWGGGKKGKKNGGFGGGGQE